MIVVPDLSLEIPLWQAGLTALAGIDEAGRGAPAGPVSAGAVALAPNPTTLQLLPGVRDSKQMSARQREIWVQRIQTQAACWAVGWASAAEIDQIGIAPATRLAAQRAIQTLSISPQYLLLDYFRLPEIALPQIALPKGDQRSLSIAAASVLAKTARDARLRQMDAEFPEYGFARHKGYGTDFHRQEILSHGPCALHRKTFSPMREKQG